MVTVIQARRNREIVMPEASGLLKGAGEQAVDGKIGLLRTLARASAIFLFSAAVFGITRVSGADSGV